MEQHLGPDHYERPARIIALYARLQEDGLLGRCWRLVPRKAMDAELLTGHSREHISKVDGMFAELYPQRPEDLRGDSYCYADGKMRDVYVCGGTANAARYAAGCCVEACLAVLRGTVRSALAVVRPPGHHAECERAMGFCFYNNVAVATLVALQQPGVDRVAVIDWDVHHGNGIQEILAPLSSALYISLHRDPKKFYPYTTGYVGEVGEGPGRGFNVNVPWLKKGMGDGDYMAAFKLILEPILDAYQPDLVIVAAGFDAADGDPLGGCKVSPEGYAWMTQQLMRYAGGRLVLALEGGYNTRVTSWCAAACVRTLLEGRAPPLPLTMERLWPAEAFNSLKLVHDVQREHWPALAAQPFQKAWDAHTASVTQMLGSAARSRRSGSAGGAAGPSDGVGEGMSEAKQLAAGIGSAGAAAAGPGSLAQAFAARKAARPAGAAAMPTTAPAGAAAAATARSLAGASSSAATASSAAASSKTGSSGGGGMRASPSAGMKEAAEARAKKALPSGGAAGAAPPSAATAAAAPAAAAAAGGAKPATQGGTGKVAPRS